MSRDFSRARLGKTCVLQAATYSLGGSAREKPVGPGSKGLCHAWQDGLALQRRLNYLRKVTNTYGQIHLPIQNLSGGGEFQT